MQILLMTGHEGAEVEALKARLAAELGGDAISFPGVLRGATFDSDTEGAARRWQAGMGIVADGVIGPRCLALLGLSQAARRWSGARPGRGAQAVPRHQALEHRALPALRDRGAGGGRPDRPPDDPGRAGHHPRRDARASCRSRNSRRSSTRCRACRRSAPTTGTRSASAWATPSPATARCFAGRGFVQLTGRDNYKRYGAAHRRRPRAPIPTWPMRRKSRRVLLALFLADRAPSDARRAGCQATTPRRASWSTAARTGWTRFKSVFELAARLWPAPRAGARPPAAGARHAAGRCREQPGQARVAHARHPQGPGRPARPAVPAAAGQLARRVSAAAPTSASSCRSTPGRPDPRPGPGGRLHRLRPGLRHQLPALAQGRLAGEAGIGEPAHALQLCAALRRVRRRGLRRLELPRRAQGLVQPRRVPRSRLALRDRDAPAALRLRRARAAPNTLGVYYRIDTKSITDLQAAICRPARSTCRPSRTTAGTTLPTVSCARSSTHETLPVIAFDGRPSQAGGHAFALVGFNAEGFIAAELLGRRAGARAASRCCATPTGSPTAWTPGWPSLGVPGVVLGQLASGGARGRTRRGAGGDREPVVGPKPRPTSTASCSATTAA